MLETMDQYKLCRLVMNSATPCTSCLIYIYKIIYCIYLPIKLLPKTMINSHEVFFTTLKEGQIVLVMQTFSVHAEWSR